MVRPHEREHLLAPDSSFLVRPFWRRSPTTVSRVRLSAEISRQDPIVALRSTRGRWIPLGCKEPNVTSSRAGSS